MGEYHKVVGIITLCLVALEPFAMKALDGRWEGIAADLRAEEAGTRRLCSTMLVPGLLKES